MRKAQIALFVLGTASLIASVFFIGTDTGDTLWRAGMAVLLLDVASLELWPSAKRP